MRNVLAVFLLILGFDVFAQNELDSHVNLSFGLKSFYTPAALSATSTFDFMNSITTSNPQNDEGILSLDSRFRLKNNAALDLDVSLYSDLTPRSIEASYMKKLTPYFGVLSGVGRYEFYVYYRRFAMFPEFDILDDIRNHAFYLSFDQHTLKNSFVHFSPFFHFKRKRLLLESQLGLGLNSFNRIEFATDYTINDTFEKRGTKIQTKPSVAPFVRPSVSIAYMPFTLKNSAIGFRFNWHTTFSNRAINYDRTTYRWLRENSVTIAQKMPKHLFRESQFDFGLNWQW